MVNVVLRGSLSRYGGPYRFSGSKIRTISSALCNQIKGFRNTLSEGSYQILLQRDGKELEIEQDRIDVLLNDNDTIFLTPALECAGRGKGMAKTVIGVVIMAAAVISAIPSGGASIAGAAAAEGAAAGAAAGTSSGFGAMMGAEAFSVLGSSISYARIAGIGLAMTMTGIYQAFLAPSPTRSVGQSTDSRASFIYNGPVNTSSQGGCVPLVMGEFYCGSVVVSSDLTSERII